MEIEEYARLHPQFYCLIVPPLLGKHLTCVEWESYLDLGCGDGSLLYALNTLGCFRGKTVYAVDLSERRVNLARRINPDFRCFVDSACELANIPENAIDFVVSTAVIEHVPSDEDMIHQIRRVAADGATIYLTTVFKKPYAWYFYRCNGRWVLDPAHVREYTSDDSLLDIFRNNGFEIVETVKSLIRYPIIDLFMRWVRAGSHVFSRSRLLRLLRRIRLPIPGYYYWEIVCKVRK